MELYDGMVRPDAQDIDTEGVKQKQPERRSHRWKES